MYLHASARNSLKYVVTYGTIKRDHYFGSILCLIFAQTPGDICFITILVQSLPPLPWLVVSIYLANIDSLHGLPEYYLSNLYLRAV